MTPSAPLAAASLLAQQAPFTMLDPPTRAVLLMALLAFVVLAMGLILGAMIGGRWVRRLGGDDLRKPLPLRREAGDATDHELPAMLRGPHFGATGDTARIDGPSTETRPG